MTWWPFRWSMKNYGHIYSIWPFNDHQPLNEHFEKIYKLRITHCLVLYSTWKVGRRTFSEHAHQVPGGPAHPVLRTMHVKCRLFKYIAYCSFGRCCNLLLSVRNHSVFTAYKKKNHMHLYANFGAASGSRRVTMVNCFDYEWIGSMWHDASHRVHITTQFPLFHNLKTHINGAHSFVSYCPKKGLIPEVRKDICWSWSCILFSSCQSTYKKFKQT